MTDLPAAAVQKGAKALRDEQFPSFKGKKVGGRWGELAEAVLRAATREITCCWCHGSGQDRDYLGHETWEVHGPCRACRGAGTIRIVDGEPNEENAGNEHRAGAHDEVT